MNKKILIVDDDILFLEAFAEFLVEEGFMIEFAERVSEINKLLSSFVPDLIILDIHLEDGDGRTVCNDIKIRSETEHIPIIILTGLSYEEIGMLDCRADAILGKPCDTQNLLLTINYLI